MQQLTIYTSTQDCPKVQHLAFKLHRELACQVVLLPLSQLPPPTAQGKLAALRLEQEELTTHLNQADAGIRAIGRGEVDAEPGQLDGLKNDRDALLSRLRGIERALGAQKGGQGLYRKGPDD